MVEVVLDLEDSGRVALGACRVSPAQEVSELTRLASPLSVQTKLTPTQGKAKTDAEADTSWPLSPPLPAACRGLIPLLTWQGLTVGLGGLLPQQDTGFRPGRILGQCKGSCWVWETSPGGVGGATKGYGKKRRESR